MGYFYEKLIKCLLIIIIIIITSFLKTEAASQAEQQPKLFFLPGFSPSDSKSGENLSLRCAFQRLTSCLPTH